MFLKNKANKSKNKGPGQRNTTEYRHTNGVNVSEMVLFKAESLFVTQDRNINRFYTSEE